MASRSSKASESQQGKAVPMTVTFARRTSSGRYVNYSRESNDLDSEIGSGEFMNYTVQIPPTPDNQPMDSSVSQRVEEQYVSNSLFTGGFNSVTRAHLMDKVIESETSHPQMAGAKGSSCAIPGCDGKVMSDERGEDILPCECDFKICRDCYVDAVKSGDGMCPGCKEPYRATDLDQKVVDNSRTLPLPLPSNVGMSKMERRLSLMKSAKSGMLTKSQTGEFDHNRWLFETKGTYGYGNAIWPEEGGLGNEKTDGVGEPSQLLSKPWRPLTRKLKIPAAVLSPYRLLIFVRIAALSLFLAWRLRHQNDDAPWLWFMSVVCEVWFAFSWLLDQLPKFCPVNRATDLNVLKDKFETSGPHNPTGKSDLPGIDVFVSTADPEKEPPLVTANTILSILAADYPVEKLSCYVSDDGGALLTFEAMAEAASFANLWVPFCRKHDIEPRNPETYFNLKRDPYKNKVRQDFVKDRRRVKREYDEFKVRINGLPDSIRRRSDAFNAREEIKAMKLQRENAGDEPVENIKIPKATWMADGTHWPGTWMVPSAEHTRGDHAGIIQVMLKPPSDEPLHGAAVDSNPIDLTEVDIRLPLLVYVSREKRPGYDHNKKAGAMNALVRASAIMSNGPFILNLDCDHYVYNSQALREGMCFMMDRGGDRICYVQFPQRFEGIDPSDRYANHNTVFFDVNMRALDGLQGPVYVGTGCLFRRIALYGFDPPRSKDYHSAGCCSCCFARRKKSSTVASAPEENRALQMGDSDEEEMNLSSFPKKFGNSSFLVDSIPVAEFQGRPLADHPAVRNGRPPGALTIPRDLLDASTVAEAISVISCWYEDKTEWGTRVGWIYGSVTEDVVTGYRMHNRGWRSVYCVTKRDAFRGTAPINLTDRLHQVLRWATGSVEIFFSRNNALLASPKMKLLQRIAYLNVGIYPFTSIFLIVYCFLPALSLFSGQFIVQSLNVAFLTYLLLITLTLCMLAVLEIKWSGIALEEWWRNEQFWLIGGTSAHLAAVLQGLLKVIAGIEISFTLTSKSAGDDADDEYADLYIIKWTSLMIPPITIMMVNLIAIAVGVSRTIYSTIPQWSRLLGGVFFSFWVLAHLYPFAKGLMGRRGRTPTIVFVWSGLLAITISLLWVAINPPSGSSEIGGSFQFP
ncbi:cellulose synthase-like protein D3 [Diospyros lotus]|uniref:cellulose synthase-like protein D3 n=1 Tax=Diospyros lotus TaxID=55363 RepID=UPI00225BA8B2|nr:cellulose synthase-like protein D3 [Diospyros lotus]XP_052171373.1 cellulose synthase-like protein D3 [Diospyros lotus]XP_052171374.1 cellulose synthase-like protein D3 [Diospyros lotus]